VVFEFLAHSPLGFWIIAFLIIVADSSLFLPPGRFTFAIGRRLNVKIRIADNPFLLRGKEPILTLFAYPITPFFVSSINVPPRGRSGAKRLLLGYKRVVFNCGDLAILASVSLLLVLIVGPLISLQYGIERALITTLPAEYVTALFGVIIVYLNRSIYELNRRDFASIAIELALCPILLVNIFKKIAARQQVVCAIDLMEHFSEDRSELTRRLSDHVEATKQ
jgi:hypothetical protein